MNHPPAILNPDLTMVEAARVARERGHILQFNGSSFVLAPVLLSGFNKIITGRFLCHGLNQNK